MTDYTIAADTGTVIAQVSHIDLDEDVITAEDALDPVALTEKDVAYNLAELLYEAEIAGMEGGDDGSTEVHGYPTLFSESGMLTMNEGLTIRLKNGQEFQLTIVQSR